MNKDNGLRELYEQDVVEPGETFEYNGFTFERVEGEWYDKELYSIRDEDSIVKQFSGYWAKSMEYETFEGVVDGWLSSYGD